MNNKTGIRQSQYLIFIQMMITVLLSLVIMSSYGRDSGLSALLGGLTCFIPNIFFAHATFRYHGARNAKKIVNGFYKGGFYKLIMTAFMFGLFFTQSWVDARILILTFIMAQSAFWLMPFINFSNKCD